MDKIILDTRQEILERELKKYTEKKTMLELQIALQGEFDPAEMSAKKPLKFSNGTPISWEQITRKEHIEILEEELKGVNLILNTIKNLK